MPKMVVLAQVDNLAKWEAGFRTHGDFFRRQTVSKPIDFALLEPNTVVVCVAGDSRSDGP